MGDLPFARITPCRAFEKVRIDFVGPINIKFHHKGKHALFKSYLCLFVCMSTKAVHLELVSDIQITPFYWHYIDLQPAESALQTTLRISSVLHHTSKIFIPSLRNQTFKILQYNTKFVGTSCLLMIQVLRVCGNHLSNKPKSENCQKALFYFG